MLKADRTTISKSNGRRNVARKAISKHRTSVEVTDYRHNQKRKNNPEAGFASYNYKTQERVKYSYDPHLDPQLIWAGKAEHTSFDVEIVSLHIHERLSTQAILKSVQRAGKTRQIRLFAEPELPLDMRIEFYQHEMEWSNRLILGDSLHVMNSLLERELMAGKVQMIYIDPPYGINYASNFQPRIGKRDVKDKDEDLTREPEQIKAYRDTWELGVHSYLTYLRDRLFLARELLHEEGSCFVQIGDENVHLVRSLMDEVFGSKNFVSQVSVFKTSTPSALLDNNLFYLLWYAKEKSRLKYRQLFVDKPCDEWARETKGGSWGVTINEVDRPMRPEEKANTNTLPENAEVYQLSGLTSAGADSKDRPFIFRGETFYPGSASHWKSPDGLHRLVLADRIESRGGKPWFKKYHKDFSYVRLTNAWVDTSGKATERLYVVQTQDKVIERCLLMTTDPGDLVLDPTCGSGTTAHCAEKLGRRWITCDTSRVALAIARQRLMTAVFDHYKLADPERGPASGFVFETIPHITLQTIARNTDIDETASKYQKQIDAAVKELNRTLGVNWKDWEVPQEPDPKWSDTAKKAHQDFWTLKARKRREIEDCIRRNARHELLYDSPELQRGLVRVSGPFTVEAIPVAVREKSADLPIPVPSSSVASDYVNMMIEFLQKSGIVFPGGRKMTIENLRPILSAGFLHAEGEATQNGGKARVAFSFGPPHGPITAKQVDESIRSSYRLGFDVLVLAGMVFDPEAQATIQKNPIPKLTVHLANISPDIIVGEYAERPLLKTTKASQLFTVFGQPDVKIEKGREGFVVKLLGVDIYNPETGEVYSSSASEVPAWFLDEDYDGYTFRVCQAFFPKEGTAKNPWDKLENALRGVVDKEKMEMFRGTQSLPFKAGEEKRIAVKVINNRGNEVMVVKVLHNGKE